MLRPQIILVVVAILCITGLSLMPKVVVNNDSAETAGIEQPVDQEAATSQSAASEHHMKVSEEQQEMINAQRELWENATEAEQAPALKKLMDLYRSINRIDSAAIVSEQYTHQHPELANYLQTGNLYYEAFTFSLDKTRQQLLGTKTREFLQKALEEDASLLDLKVKVGMTYVSTSNPMQGILMIREVLQEDPDNLSALYNLGVLSMESGQHHKAIERFEHLLRVDASNLQARFLLGVSYRSDGQTQKAIEQFEYVKAREKNPEILQTVNNYLEELQH
ncbi:tetratricopeptide repeat protein [Rapidithrix thailandica]|uniref:Tetratricopeptide repeat protein n=1 Tax=Rapidithrix thailandica TaxID=413964 RepID=A0AAW9RZS4_9BACT